MAKRTSDGTAVTVRLSDELIKRIDAQVGSRNRASFLRKAATHELSKVEALQELSINEQKLPKAADGRTQE
jgi:predicted transcriptional regulator